MELQEWEPISKLLFSAFPQANATAETVIAFYADLAEFDARDVDAACTYLRQNEGPFLPSVARIREQTRLEEAARLEHSRLPDVTGIALLPPAEQEKLRERGLILSAGGDPDDATSEQLRDMFLERRALAEGATAALRMLGS